MKDFDRYTLNADSIKEAYNRILDMHTNFPPFTEAQLIEVIETLVEDLPYEGTLKEREEFLKETVEALIEKDEDLVLAE